jgi:hypothetical protein
LGSAAAYGITPGVSDLDGYEEEKLDQLLFRPLSHGVAVAAGRIGLTPNGVSILGMLFGVAGGYFFQFREARLVVWGVALFCLRNILDYADGQLARLTGKGSRYGYFYDGLCDYVAYVSVYAFGVVGIWPEYGLLGLAVAAIGTWSSGLHSSYLEFFKREYRFWALGSDKDRFKTPDELRGERAAAKGLDRFLLVLAIRYFTQQQKLTRHRLALHEVWLPHRDDPAFRERYSRLNRWPLKALFLIGPNWQAYTFFVFGLLGRMDLFFLVQLVGFNVIWAVATVWQRAMDRRLAQE